MNQDLKQALEIEGWDDVYARHLEFTGPANGRGERRARSLWPDVDHDNEPSLSVNVGTGLFRCFKKSERKGNYVNFRCWFDATEYDERGALVPVDYREMERRLLQEFNVSTTVNGEWVNHCAQQLRGYMLMGEVQSRKPWSAEVAAALGVGYDPERNKIVFPCYDRIGALINARLYDFARTARAKFIWAVGGLSGNFLWPHQGWSDSSYSVLVEGEPDALSLRSFGINGVSGTFGSGTPVPEGYWYRDKKIYVLMDVDEEGQKAARVAAEIMVHLAGEVIVCRLPEWPDRPDNADVSDYIMFLQRQGHSPHKIQEAIWAVLEAGAPLPRPDAVFDAEPTAVGFANIFDPRHYSDRLAWSARVTAKSERVFNLPITFQVTCPAEGHQYCRRCPMQERTGNQRALHDPRDPRTLKMIRHTDQDQVRAIKEVLGIPSACPDVRVRVEETVSVLPVVLNAPIQEIGTDDPDAFADYHRKEALILMRADDRVEENAEFQFEGFVYSDPKTQQATILVDRFSPIGTQFDRFQITPELVRDLKIFQPRSDQTVLEKLTDVVRDLADTVTLIRGRDDLHLAYRTVWHSVLQFTLGHETVDRGWLECLVLGDTGCGKSQAFKRMAEHYGLGLLIDCKNQTSAGILGAVVQSASGEWFVTPGIYPQNDNRLVCLDEFQTRTESGRDFISVMASVRSEGVVTIAKAAAGKFKARVRSIWLANPGQGRLLSELGAHGVEWIRRLIRQPEDIRRFDFALAVAQADVSNEVLFKPPSGARPKYPRQLAQQLLAWTYSRTPDQVYFEPECVGYLYECVEWMLQRYHEKIPLVERNDQRKRLAKVAVSVAAQCFSTDEAGELIVVTPLHVHAALQLFTTWYDKEAMGYNRWSVKAVQEDQLEDYAEALKVFEETLAPNGRRAAQSLLSMVQFREQMFKNLMPSNALLGLGLLQQLLALRFVRPVDAGRTDAYELTPAGARFLQEYLESYPNEAGGNGYN